jgi:urea carboxylase
LQIHYDGTRLARNTLLGALREIERELPSVDGVSVPGRIVHLPLSWNDPEVVLAMRKYQELVRPDAPWCPSNIEFIRRINGLDDEAAVKAIIHAASYLVLGLGDVYLGAPVATPIDPRHRLVTTKYNPARTWTPENAVGIGGAYMCIYGMEGPGGYQLFGRTIQMWNSWRRTPVFEEDTPWLLRCFDQIRFFPVSAAELIEARAAFPHGAYPLDIEPARFSYAEYRGFLKRENAGIEAFKRGQQTAFEAERRRWREARIGEAPVVDPVAVLEGGLPGGCFGAFSDVPGNIWKILVGEGACVEAGDPLALVESMKMEIAIVAAARGVVHSILVKPGQTVRAGDLVMAIEEV